MHAFAFFKLIICRLPLCLFMIMATPSHAQNSQVTDNLPSLYGLKLDRAQVTIDVLSSGCTEASQFSVQIDIDSEAPDIYHLSIIRHQQDRCKMSPYIVALTLDLPTVPNLTAAKFFLRNSMAAPVTLFRTPDP
jgi:hypothetical protein